jgi:hypothetical protein
MDAQLPNLKLIAQAQTAGQKVTAYGKFAAEKIMDRWDFKGSAFNSGLEQLGTPAGSFPAGTLIAGSPEAKAAVASAEQKRIEEAKVAAEKIERERKEAVELAEKQKRQADENAAKTATEQKAYRDRLLEATRVGQRYVGVLTENGQTKQAIEMRVLEQSGFLLTVEFRNPDSPAERVRWKGELNSKHSPDSAPINLSAIDSTKSGWDFYSLSGGGSSGNLALKLNEEAGIEGSGKRYSPYSLKLQPAPASKSSSSLNPTPSSGDATGLAAVKSANASDAVSVVDLKSQPIAAENLQARLERVSAAGTVLHGEFLGEPNSEGFDLKKIVIANNGAFTAEFHERRFTISVVGRITESTMTFKGGKWIVPLPNAALWPHECSYELVLDPAGKLVGKVKYSPPERTRPLFVGQYRDGPIAINL